MKSLIRSALMTSLVTCAASAQPTDPGRADVLFREGRTALKAGDVHTACPKLEESYRLDPAAGTAVNLGDCFERQGKIASALLAYQTARSLLPPGDPRISPVTAQIVTLENRVPRLTIRLAPGAPAGTIVKRGDVDVGEPGLGVPLPVNPGVYEVVVVAPGRSETRERVTLAEGEQRQLIVAAGPKAAGPPRPAPMPDLSDRTTTFADQNGPPRGSSDPRASGDRRTTGVVIGALGVAGLAVGAIAGVAARNAEKTNREHCNDTTKTCDQDGVDAGSTAATMAVLSNVGWVVGGLGLGVGGYLFVTSGGSSDPQGARPTTGFRLVGTWQ